jgi:hypothetical protein
MKIGILCMLLSLSFWLNAQVRTDSSVDYSRKLLGNWAKDYVDMKDGSRLTNPEIDKVTATMLIFRKENAGVIILGKDASPTVYVTVGDTLLVGGTVLYHIDKLTPYELVFSQIIPNTPDYQLRRYHYLSTKESASEYFFRQFIKPNLRIQANGDTLYAFNKYIFPRYKGGKDFFKGTIYDDFDDVYQFSYEDIERNFNYPERQAGLFKIAFQVSKDGVLKNVEIKESSDSAYNNQLLKAVLQTRKSWLPAVYDGKLVDVVFNYEFRYGEENQEPEDYYYDEAVYESVLKRANKQFELNNYGKAIKLYTKCVLMKDDAFEALYKRADCYFALKIEKNACSDWNYLSLRGQKKAENLFISHCVK